METILIIVVLLLLFGGGGGYYLSRRGRQAFRSGAVVIRQVENRGQDPPTGVPRRREPLGLRNALHRWLHEHGEQVFHAL